MRTAVTPLPFAQGLSSLPDFRAASLNGTLGTLVVTFDGPIAATAVTPAAWTIRAGAKLWTPTLLAVNGNDLVCTVVPAAGPLGAPTITYTATPPDVYGIQGTPVRPFGPAAMTYIP